MIKFEGVSAMKRVKCSVCVYQTNGYCSIKKVSVSPNKKRDCDYYSFDKTKVKESKPIASELRPDWYWNRKELLSKHRRELKKIEEGKKINPNYVGSIPVSDHPLTGDLSRFTSTAVKSS